MKMVVYQKNKSIAMITLNRPDAENRINIEVADALRDIRHQINQDETVKVIIITGQGNKAFCSGICLALQDQCRRINNILGRTGQRPKVG
jgi:enoyl-CoA hydratase/carnithine racemase